MPILTRVGDLPENVIGIVWFVVGYANNPYKYR
jgi:hypothetical protein